MSEPEWKPGDPIDTVFVFGSGICSGSWDPVRQAILDVDSQAPVEVTTTAADGERHGREVHAANESANFWFSDFVHKRRRLEAFLEWDVERLRARGWIKENYAEWQDVLRKRKTAFAEADKDLKQALVRRLKEAVATGKLQLRRQFWQLMRDPRFKGSCLFLTTNWDTAFEQAAEVELPTVPRIWHIHGSTGFPERLLLPSEVVEEPYRSEEERLQVASSIHWSHGINSARQVCVYGLSVSPADAELAQTFEVGFAEHKIGPGTVLILNKADQLDIIARRLRRLAPGWRMEKIDVDALRPA